MELLDRYLAAVAHHLPQDQQADVTRELRANILDKLDAEREAGTAGADEALLAGILTELGRPRAMAHRYCQPPALIRPEHVPIYSYTLFMVFGVLFLIQIVHSSIIWLSSDSMGLLLLLKSIAGGFIRDASFAFTVISLAFWLMGRQEADRPAVATAWSPDQLPPLTRKWQRIGLNDIFNDLGLYLFLLMLIWYPVWVGLPGSLQLSDSARFLLQAFSPLLVLGLGLGVWQLVRRVWTPALLRSKLVLNLMLIGAILSLAFSGPLLLSVPQGLGWLDQAHLSRSISITLLIIALLLAWEVLRDGRRLRQLRRAAAASA